MSDRWYYAHDDNKVGPFSGRQLLDLAVVGEILRTDTVWKEGIEKGVLATRVQYLFPPAPVVVFPVGPDAPPDLVPSSSGPTARTSGDGKPAPAGLSTGNIAEEAIAGEAALPTGPPPADIPDDIRLQAEATAPVNTNLISSPPYTAPKRRAVAVKGAAIVGQDGTRVRFRKKCAACGYEDQCWSTLQITLGSMKTTFCCSKCLKKQGVEMKGLRA
jgi:hypothetical protein